MLMNLLPGIISQDYFGFGDNIYKRPVIKELSRQHERVFLYTAFPELFSDIPNVSFCRPETQLKTQQKNIQRHDQLGTWVKAPESLPVLRLNYGMALSEHVSIIHSLEKDVPILNFEFTLPDISLGEQEALGILSRARQRTTKKICIVRLPSVRTEWACGTRNPLMEYFIKLMEENRDKFYFISVGDTDNLTERFSETPPTTLWDESYHGTLGIFTTLNLIKGADMVLSAPCFTIPLGIALQVPTFIIFGGYVKPELHTDPRMNLSKYGFVAPQPFCNCVRNVHECNKFIDYNRLTGSFWNFLCKTNLN